MSADAPVYAHSQEESNALLRIAPVAWGVALLAAIVLLRYAVPSGEDVPLKFAAVVFLGCGLLWVFPFSHRAGRRALICLFLLAFAVRLGSAVLFDSLGRAAGDRYAGSPDAWAYDLWARRLVTAWSELRNLDLHAYYAAGRWDVGFHYVLAIFYAIFGESVLGGRVLVAFFGAVSVVFLFLVARRIAGDRVATWTGLLSAFWLSSAAWSGYSILRDSLVWALTLLAVWLALRVVDGASLSGLGFFFVLVLLRAVRPYAAAFVVIGLGVAGVLAILRRCRGTLRPAVILMTAILATEAVFFVTGFPSPVRMVSAYQPRRVLLKPLEKAPSPQVWTYRGTRPMADLEEDRRLPPLPPPRLFGPSLAANAMRFFLNPPAWAPVSGNIRQSDNWQLPGMWAWYAILPLAGLGFFLSLKRSFSLQSITITTALFILLLTLVGRGDLTRQREMVVPVVLLWFVVGLLQAVRRPALLLAAYALYAVLLGSGIAYHRSTLRARGLALGVFPADRALSARSCNAGAPEIVMSGRNDGLQRDFAVPVVRQTVQRPRIHGDRAVTSRSGVRRCEKA